MTTTRRRRVRWAASALSVVAATGVAAVLFDRWPVRPPVAPASAAPAGTSVPVTLTTLTETVIVDGELGYGPSEPIESRATGTITWLPAVGTVLRRGDVLFRVDDRPVVLLHGTLPMYRSLATGTEGRDVTEFEDNLRALGYRLPVDRRFDEATASAVRRWQRRLGVEETGVVDVASVAYTPGPVRIAAHVARVGADASGQLLSYTADVRMVTAQVPAIGTAWAVPGVPITIELPGGATTAGVVASVGTTAAAPAASGSAEGAASGGQAGGRSGGQEATVEVRVSIQDQARLGTLDRAPVRIRYVARERRDVLTVPVVALVAPIEGGYAVEVVEGSTTRVVPVEVGMFADGRVEITGVGIEAGTAVQVPS